MNILFIVEKIIRLPFIRTSQAGRLWQNKMNTCIVTQLQYESSQKGTDKISMDEIDAEIGTVRSKRKK